MAIDSGRVKEYEALQIAKQWEDVARSAGQQLMISMADPLPPGGDTGRHSPKPGQKPSSPYEEGKSPHKLQAGVLYPTRWPKNDPNAGKEPFDNKGNDLSVPVPNHPDWAC